MADYFYRAFEERFYAPREVIKQLRRQYLPFVLPLASRYPGAPTFDIGCGRGEWLELMAELGFRPFGVDLDEGMLSACVALGLPAQKGDAVAYLKSLGSETQALITAFHVVEHLSFSELRALVQEALRALKPSGLLIMETPNPENLVVATSNFYLDPTHQRPIPPQLLEFLTEYSGFEKTKILRLQESAELSEKQTPSLWNVVSGASPDYSIVAQKKGADEKPLEGLDTLFAKNFGFDTQSLAMRYESGLVGRLNEILVRVDRSAEAEAKATFATESLRKVEQQLTDRTFEAQEFRLRMERQHDHLESQQQEIDLLKRHIDWQQREWDAAKSEAATRAAEVEAMLQSLSWRLTEPLRRLNAIRRGAASYPRRILSGVRRIAEAPAEERPRHLVLWLIRRPALLALAKTAVSPFPGVRNTFNKHLALASISARAVSATTSAAVVPEPVGEFKRPKRPMSEHAARVLRDLHDGMKKR